MTLYPYETKAGTRYRVLYRTADHKQAQKRGFPNQREAKKFIRDTAVAIDSGTYIEPSALKVTVATLATTWLASQTHLKPSSLEPIQIAYRLYVEPAWGKSPIGKIKHSAVQTWVSQLSLGTAKTAHSKAPGPRSATVVRRAYGVLASILEVALRDRLIPSNPARRVSLPRKGKKPRVYLTHERVQLLAEQSGDKSTLVLTLAYSGLRWGEAVGLRVRDLDALRRRLNVRENATRVAGQIVVGTPKTHETRSVPFPEFLTLPLAQAAEGKTSTQLLFGNGLEHLRTPSSNDGWWIAAVRAAQKLDLEFPTVTPHDLRHTAASLAISAGANVKAVQRMLGHASAAMTLDTYADLFDEDLDAVATALNHAVTQSSVAKSVATQPEKGRPIAQIPRKQRDVQP